MCDRLVEGISNLNLQRKLLEKKDLTFVEARKICEQHDDLMKATSSEAVILFQRQKAPPNRPPTAKCASKPHKDSSGNEKRINPCFSCGAHHLRSICRFRNVKCHACGKINHMLRHLVVKCSNNAGDMNVQPTKLEVDGEPIFLKRRVIPYGQRDGVLQALEKMKRDGKITQVTSKPNTFLTHASNVGIGAVLEQEGCPVICISRLLNAAENGYSQTQREALAVFWAVQRLHKYLFGFAVYHHH
ncbi:unnamed protein product [Echinostoma caproni]|uniref:RT_RNaseH_2 domain-containing protein n=1 Tax=Echinostoma caproni TaxID=27848 RepID=A0A183AMV6_9TREM|nr:unnamed protein product [Echinostoma caproni]